MHAPHLIYIIMCMLFCLALAAVFALASVAVLMLMLVPVAMAMSAAAFPETDGRQGVQQETDHQAGAEDAEPSAPLLAAGRLLRQRCGEPFAGQ